MLFINRLLETSANYFLRKDTPAEKISKGLELLRRGVSILENEGRPAQAANLAFKMISLGLKLDVVGSEMIEMGRTCLKMFVMTSNVKMTGSCLIILTLVLVRHFENTALDDARKLLHENIVNIDTDVQEVMKKILKTLEDGDFSKIDEIHSAYSQIKEGKNTLGAVKSLMSVESGSDSLEQHVSEGQKTVLIDPVNSNRNIPVVSIPKVVMAAAGTAVAASAFGSSKIIKKDSK